MSSIMRRRSGLMAVSVIGGSCLEVSRLRTPRSSGRDAARTITRSPHAAHLERCPARSALPRERVRSVAQTGSRLCGCFRGESRRFLGRISGRDRSRLGPTDFGRTGRRLSARTGLWRASSGGLRLAATPCGEESSRKRQTPALRPLWRREGYFPHAASVTAAVPSSPLHHSAEVATTTGSLVGGTIALPGGGSWMISVLTAYTRA